MEAGDVLKAPYVLEQLIGRGGQGECWLVRDEQQEIWLAKLYPLHREGWEPYDLVEREATFLQQLEHPGIPAFRDVFLLPQSSTLCLIREWLPGQNLEQRLTEHRFSEEEVRHIAVQMLDILCYIHGLSPSLIHRDIKPSNVIVRSDQSLALIDFGSVRDAIYEGERMSVMGTYGYTPPEQFLGHPTPASDLYALGATLIYLLSRQHPSTLPLQHNKLQFESYVNVQPRFMRVLQQLLAPTVEARCQSAAEAKEAILRCEGKGQAVTLVNRTGESLEETLSRAAAGGRSDEASAQVEVIPSAAWQRRRQGLPPWIWERYTPLLAGESIAATVEQSTPVTSDMPALTSNGTQEPTLTQPDLRPVVQLLRERHQIDALDDFSDALEVVTAIDEHFGVNDDTGRLLLLRLLHPYDASDILFGFYAPSFVLERLATPLMERFSLLFTHAEDNAIKQWVLCYFLQKHSWVPQDIWHRKQPLIMSHVAREQLGMPRRMERFFQRYHEMPTGKQAKKFAQLVEHWEQLSRHYHLCCSLRPGHLSLLVERGYNAFLRDVVPMYPTERQEAWYRDRLLRWSLRSMTAWPPHWLGPALRKDAIKYHKLGAYIGSLFQLYERFDTLRNRLQEEYHWLLNGA